MPRHNQDAAAGRRAGSTLLHRSRVCPAERRDHCDAEPEAHEITGHVLRARFLSRDADGGVNGNGIWPDHGG